MTKILIPDKLIKEIKKIFGLEKVPTVVEIRPSLDCAQDSGAEVLGYPR